MARTDVLVVGAGVAGCAAARLLAQHHRVLVLDRFEVPPTRIGESVPGAARQLLQRLGLFEKFEAAGHRASLGQASLWGSDRVHRRDSLNDPLGSGWCIDRVAFETMLRGAVRESGAQMMAPARLVALLPFLDGRHQWRANVQMGDKEIEVDAEFVVLAHGRSRPPNMLGFTASVQAFDRLVCRFVRVPSGLTFDARSGFSFVEAGPEGWWYQTTVPSGHRVVAYHTDADLPSARRACSREGFCELLQGTQGLVDASLSADTVVQRVSARSQALSTAGGAGWCAVGDAACAFDPLSSQGIFNALYTGVRGAEATSAAMQGDEQALPSYCDQMAQVFSAYRANLERVYRLERRFLNGYFWQRRHKQMAMARMSFNATDL